MDYVIASERQQPRAFIQTAGGKSFDLLKPGTWMIEIEDIAHALSHVCRFAGHTRAFYSVAQHSVMVSCLVPKEHALAGLLHDAAEAYIGDLTSPLKGLLPAFREIEDNIQTCITKRFGLQGLPESVKQADLVMLATERRDLLIDQAEPWPMLEGVQPLKARIKPFSPNRALHAFLDRFEQLTREA